MIRFPYRHLFAEALRALLPLAPDQAVRDARAASVARYGERDAATHRQLGALLSLARNGQAGEVGQRLVGRAARDGLDGLRAAELLEHMRARRRLPA